MKRRRRGAGIELTMDCADFWRNRGRYAKSNMLRALHEQNEADGIGIGNPRPATVPVPEAEEGGLDAQQWRQPS